MIGPYIEQFMFENLAHNGETRPTKAAKRMKLHIFFLIFKWKKRSWTKSFDQEWSLWWGQPRGKFLTRKRKTWYENKFQRRNEKVQPFEWIWWIEFMSWEWTRSFCAWGSLRRFAWTKNSIMEWNISTSFGSWYRTKRLSFMEIQILRTMVSFNRRT